MAALSETSILCESQARHLLAVFSRVDDLLGAIGGACEPRPSPFGRIRSDLAPDEVRLLGSFASLARARMAEACDRLGVERPQPSVSARWSAETALNFADIAVADLAPSVMRGYGSLTVDAEREMSALAAALGALMARGMVLLRESRTGDLAAEAAAVPGPAGEVLRRLERLSADHALAEVRPLLAAALDRALSRTLDVGVFGRVSSGKSSLLNALVGEPALPVGATPTTAVPLVVQRGPARLELQFRDGRRLVGPIADVSAYATEERNPENGRGVRSLALFLPGVPEHMRLLDTPGVGSLSESGPAQAFASLPRCDLGLVLVAAGNPFGTDDLALVSALSRAGIPCHVLLSKCDQLAPDELRTALRYLDAELDRALGPGRAMAALPISTRPGYAGLLRDLRERILEPAIADSRRSTGVALAGRLRRLVAMTDDAIAGRQSSIEGELRVQRVHRRAEEAIRALTSGLAAGSLAALASAARAIHEAWARGGDGGAAAAAAMTQPASQALASVRGVLDDASAILGMEAAPRRLPPVFDPEILRRLPDLSPPRLGRKLLGARLSARRLAPLAGPLHQAFCGFAQRVAAWGEGALRELTAAAPTESPRNLPARAAALADLDELMRELEGTDAATHEEQRRLSVLAPTEAR